MAQVKVDWTVLRGTIGSFGLCVLVSAIMLTGSFYFRAEMEAQFRSNHAQFRGASRKYLSVDEDAHIIEQYYPQFVALHAAGIVGQEHRLDWLETLRAASDSLRLPEMSYRIDSQTALVPDFPVILGGFDINASNMELSLGLLHEGDLEALLNALDTHAKGLYSVSRCDLSRTDREPRLDLKHANLNAECVLKWFTVDLKGERKISL